MIIDYIGQELIWGLLGTHLYMKNNPHYSIKIKCKTREDNFNAKKFILTHVPKDKLCGIDYKYNFPHVAVAKKIYVRNSFGYTSEVEFINEFEDDSEGENNERQSESTARRVR